MTYDEICTYEVCKLAKEKGFNEKCLNYYNRGGELMRCGLYAIEYTNALIDDGYVTAPTQSLLQRWLREEKGVCIAIYPNLRVNHSFEWIGYKKDEKCWTPVVSNMKAYNTYELALEDALKYALEKLVN